MANYQKFLTKADEKKLPPLYAQDGKGMEAIAFVKFFTPWTSFTWYATEFDGEDTFFGLVDTGTEKELGYFSKTELQSIRGNWGLKIERDMYFTPKKLSELRIGVD